MSFQSLVSGSECALPSNPLSQVLKHTEGDRTLQQDRVAGPSSSRLHHLPGTAFTPANEQDLALARQFFQARGQGFAPESAFHNPEFRPNGSAPSMGEAWAMEHQRMPQKLQESLGPSSWALEFGAPQHSIPSGAELQTPLSNVTPQQSSYMPQNTFGPSMQMGPYAGLANMIQPNIQNLQQPQFEGKGKGREIDYEAAFARLAESMQQGSSSSIVEVEDGVDGLENALKDAKLSDEETKSDFRRLWSELRGSELPPPAEDLAKWEAEFNQLMNSQREELDDDYGEAMQRAWENGIGDYESPSKMQFDDGGVPILEDYVFDKENPYLDPSTSTSSPLKDAKALLEKNGSLSEAALLLEAAIQKGDLGEGGYEAWILLGETRNMDEREEAGMRALAQGVKLAEAAGAPGPGMMSLAISFTNEGYDRASYATLLRWLRARFAEVHIPQETADAVKNNVSWDSYARVTDLFMALARDQHSKGIVDADVQVALGILFYTNSDYDRARDCFQSALFMRPDDYLLWNRLGSSLSNGSKPEEALGAYREALQLRPTYTRAIYNVGVACLNIGAHQEAAEHFLSALAMQQNTGGTSEQLWFTLRRVFSAMGRQDLYELANPDGKVDLEVFRKEGFDF